MIGAISFLIILLISMVIVRIAGVMLSLTGVSMDTAQFQARSAFTGTGFSTRESEMIVNHPVRRRIISSLMLIGNIGFVSFVSSIVLGFTTTTGEQETLFSLYILAGGLVVLFIISKSRALNGLFLRIITFFLRGFTKIHAKDYDSLLNLSGEYEIVSIKIAADHWCANKKLMEMHLSDEGILILGITRKDGYYSGTPHGTHSVFDGDTLLLYGREQSLRTLDGRPAGDAGDAIHESQSLEHNQMQGGQSETKEHKNNFFTRFFKRK